MGPKQFHTPVATKCDCSDCACSSRARPLDKSPFLGTGPGQPSALITRFRNLDASVHVETPNPNAKSLNALNKTVV